MGEDCLRRLASFVFPPLSFMFRFVFQTSHYWYSQFHLEMHSQCIGSCSPFACSNVGTCQFGLFPTTPATSQRKFMSWELGAFIVWGAAARGRKAGHSLLIKHKKHWIQSNIFKIPLLLKGRGLEICFGKKKCIHMWPFHQSISFFTSFLSCLKRKKCVLLSIWNTLSVQMTTWRS